MNRERAKALLPIIQASFSYDPLTGDIKWIKSGRGKAKKGELAGHVTKCGYRRICINQTDLMAHRVAWALYYGSWPQGIIDHIDGNGLNNKIDNLRDADFLANQRNSFLSINNRSGINGVNWNSEKQKWEAKISVHNKIRYIGRYDTLLAAAYARHIANLKYGFSNRHGISKHFREVTE